ncbi:MULTISPECIES: DUF4380 domain-containing protein [unclassified Rathayibacter]|uniref:DUF4380 domain-containing protein n=1 Tax=unclassified Rathayibacter TaxID=2609250 RepID=UPI0006FBA10D|nr:MULTISPECIES: DUF4380 domain-containing protein [unclassified Rathayibacter]KQQ05565.1 hypothetical protein ASF42_03075 [Rathayibacter sp. Leaf294]KQS13428.1 hypothetical protein ASG06_03090 [Rathayibacter sp. Leaf185]
MIVESRGDDLPLLAVTTPDLALVFAPSCGGRLLSLVVDGRELLWRNPELVSATLTPIVPVAAWPAGTAGMSSWANLGGSKTWPAPQGWSGPGEWAGPPDPVLDSGAWASEWTREPSSVEVVLTSPDDPRSGLRVTRRFTIPATGSSFGERVTFENVSATERRWAIWEVCQVATAPGGVVVVPHDHDPLELDLGSYEGAVSSSLEGRDVVLPFGSGVAKRGYPRASGSVRYREPGGASLRLATAPALEGEWPDGGSKVEVWLQRPTDAPIASLEGLHPTAHLVELEVLGPLTVLPPGGRSELEIAWSAS